MTAQKGITMKFGWLNKEIKFWCDNLNTSITTILIGFTVATLVPITITLESFADLVIYIGALIVLWGARSGMIIMDKKPKTISFRKMLILVVPCILFLFLLIIF